MAQATHTHPSSEAYVELMTRRIVPGMVDEDISQQKYETECTEFRRHGGALLEYLIQNNLIDVEELKEHVDMIEGEKNDRSY